MSDIPKVLKMGAVPMDKADNLATALRSVAEAFESFGEFLHKVLPAWRAEAVAADPGLLPHLRRVQKEIDPDIGWLDVAAQRDILQRSPGLPSLSSCLAQGEAAELKGFRRLDFTFWLASHDVMWHS